MEPIAEETIKHLEAEVRRLQNPWISVEDRLPDLIGSYLYYDEIGLELGWAFFNSNKEWCSGNEKPQSVTHWRPLPPLPVITNQDDGTK